MWFLKGKPNGVNIVSYSESKPKGYQENTFLFNVSSENSDNLWVGFPFPCAPNKNQFGFTILEKTNLFILEPQMQEYNPHILNQQDIELWDNFRKFKRMDNIDLAQVQDLIYWHIDDFAIATTWIQPNKWYIISYTHKIGADSQLFIPTRFPIFVANGKEPILINYTMWVVNAMSYLNLPEYLHKIETRTKTIQKFRVSDTFKYDIDTRFDTDNWESSDDENSESENSDSEN